jgi:hypothetical protein
MATVPAPPLEERTPEPLVCSDGSVEHFHERQNCIQCHRVYCPHFQSEIDSNFCRVCLTQQSAAVSVAPLPPDSEGIHHDGKWIMPVGSIYKTLPRAIADMDDVELGNYLAHMKAQVKNTETTYQYQKIGVSIAEVEVEHRKVLEARRLRGIKLPKQTGVVKIGSDNGTPSKSLAGVATQLKSLGVTKEMLEALLAVAKAKGGTK